MTYLQVSPERDLLRDAFDEEIRARAVVFEERLAGFARRNIPQAHVAIFVRVGKLVLV